MSDAWCERESCCKQGKTRFQAYNLYARRGYGRDKGMIVSARASKGASSAMECTSGTDAPGQYFI